MFEDRYLKDEGICLRISPWSRTSHIVTWLTAHGKVSTVVKGAMRPKSHFLGQYDLNYTCQILYCAQGGFEARALRECSILEPRDELREDWRSFVVSDRFRFLGELFAGVGENTFELYSSLSHALDRLVEYAKKPQKNKENLISLLLDWEIKVLKIAGWSPALEFGEGVFSVRGEREISISREVAHCIESPFDEKNIEILLDAARVIGVFYTFHVGHGVEGRRQILQMITSN